MKYVTIKAKTNIEDYLQEFSDAIKEVLGLKLDFNIDGFVYTSRNIINEKLFNKRDSLMEDVLGYGYKERAFGKHSISTRSDLDKLRYNDIYKYSFSNPDHPGVRFVILFQQVTVKNLAKNEKPKFEYVLKTKVSALDAYN